MHQTPASEIVKEVVFGATFGLAAGYLRKLGFKSLSGALTASFLLMRFAIFEGHHLATWSPLEQDDPAFGAHLVRKARRETQSLSKRCQVFLQDNLIIVGGFAGGITLTSL